MVPNMELRANTGRFVCADSYSASVKTAIELKIRLELTCVVN